jgi:hypothetical protein
MISHPDFPRLTPLNHRVTSPSTSDYNCVAWSAKDTERWWQPGVYWPIELPANEYGLRSLEQAFRMLGYEECQDGTLEPGFEKVALYGTSMMYTYAARQLPSNKWTSKLGHSEDIEHDKPEDVGGGLYGEVAEFMRRVLPPAEIT